jgi:hypothetical protein
MGPLFSGGFLLVGTAVALAIAVAVLRIFLPFRAALALGLVVVVAGVFGSIAGVFAQVPFLSGETFHSTGAVLQFLGIALAIGIGTALTAGGAFLHWRSSRRQ